SNQATLAQGGTPDAPGGGLSVGLQAVNACVTGDFTGAVSKALGISAGELRKDIVMGQSLQDIAQAKGVDFGRVAAGLQAAVQADVDAGVAAGRTPQVAANAMSARFGGVIATPPANTPLATPPGTPPAPGAGGPGGGPAGPAPQAALPDIGNLT